MTYPKTSKESLSEQARRLGVSRQRLHQLRNPEKHRARALLYYRVKRGRIVPPKECERCGEKKPLHAHHDDYSKPFDVVWVCAKCHSIIHPHHMTVNETPQDKVRRVQRQEAKRLTDVRQSPLIKKVESKCKSLGLSFIAKTRRSGTIQGRTCRIRRLAGRYDKYVVINPVRTAAKFEFVVMVHEERDLWLIMPNEAMPLHQTMFSPTAPTKRYPGAYSLRHDHRDYIDAWHLLEKKAESKAA